MIYGIFILTDLFRLQVMLNPFNTNNVVATSDSDSETESARNSRQLPSQLAADLPTVAVEKSSDIHIGPRQQNNEPVTINEYEYITVTGENDIEYLDQYPCDDIYILTPQTTESGNPVVGREYYGFPSCDEHLSRNLDIINNYGAFPERYGAQTPSKDVLTFQKQAWLRNRCVWSLLVFVLVAAFIIALILSMSKDESNSALPNKGNVTVRVFLGNKKEDVYVYEGHRSVQWVVNVTASSQPKLVWYGPNCQVLERRDGSIKFEVHTSPTGTELNLYNISLADRGVYRLQASNGEGEEWAYFTLNVKGKIPLDRHHVVVCYVESRAHRVQGLGNFTVDDIDPTLCTHLVYGSAVLGEKRTAIVPKDPAFDLEENNGAGAFRKMTSLKRDYPHLKVLLSVYCLFDENYSAVAELPSRRKAIFTNVSEFLRKYNFDGLDLVWRYKGYVFGDPAEKENFVSILKEFREEFDKFGLLLTAQLGGEPDIIENSYDIPAVSQYLHYMFAQCYGYNSPCDLTRPIASLYQRNEDDNLNVVSCINTLLRKGADPNKLVLALPLFGNIFKLKNPEAGVGFEKEFTSADYFRRYNEICLEVDNPNNNWTKYWDNVTHTPYASKGDQLISYDDAMSLSEKVELAVRMKLAGVLVSSLESDDFHGRCTFGSSGSTGYPLTRSINKAFDNSVSWKKVPCQ